MDNNRTEPRKYFTKSRFKLALECPSKLYYERHPDDYANQALGDEFLESLAEGGFQVGELAKLYYGILPDGGNNIRTLDAGEAVAKTKELLGQENLNIAEAAFLYDNMLVRVDILEKKGNSINIIEVKAKSWGSDKDKFIVKGNVPSGIRPYVYDVAFQKHVVSKALAHDNPAAGYDIKAFLMMADKSKKTDINCLNQLFRIVEKDGRTSVELEAGAAETIGRSKVRILTAFDVDSICDDIVAGETKEQLEYMGTTFLPFVESAKSYFLNDELAPSGLGAKCFKCQFCATDDQKKEGKRSGYEECWKQRAHFTDADFARPLVKDLWGMGIRRRDWIKAGTYFMSDINDEMLQVKSQNKTNSQEDGLHHIQRKWLQIALATQNEAKLSRFKDDMEDGVYFDKDGFRRASSSWTFPLHLIDFETSAVALPFYENMRPYEQVAFQFSHHVMNADGTIEHRGQYINTEQGRFPNFDFVRELKAQLEVDNGTIFRYAVHENSILRAIYGQLAESDEPDRQELMNFIDEITHDNEKKHKGSRDMVDLLDIVKKYYYHPSMKGSNSIKAVLPAVLNSSKYLQDKYKEKIYGATIRSKNIAAEAPIAWVQFDETGHVTNPYKTLPPISSYITDSPVARQTLENSITSEEDEDSQINNGGLALSAYGKMQFSNTSEEAREAITKALYRYCELDTMAMVFILEYFFHESKLQK